MNSNAGITIFISCLIAFCHKSVPVGSLILRASATVFGSFDSKFMRLSPVSGLDFLYDPILFAQSLVYLPSSCRLHGNLIGNSILHHCYRICSFNSDNGTRVVEPSQHSTCVVVRGCLLPYRSSAKPLFFKIAWPLVR